jgi:hypothetical protein
VLQHLFISVLGLADEWVAAARRDGQVLTTGQVRDLVYAGAFVLGLVPVVPSDEAS